MVSVFLILLGIIVIGLACGMFYFEKRNKTSRERAEQAITDLKKQVDEMSKSSDGLVIRHRRK